MIGSPKPLRLTTAEIDHVITLLLTIQARGDYYGNRAEYVVRTDRLIAKLREAAK